MKLFYFFFFIKIVISQNIALERFQNYIKSPKGCVLHIELKQSYYDEIIVSNGVFYKKGGIYVFDNQEQYVKYEDQQIKTINKINKQVIFDSMKKNNATIFDILSGNNQNIFFHPFKIQKEQINIPFEIKLWGIKGFIWSDLLDGSPKKISFTQDEDIKVDINIVSSTNDSSFTFPIYDIMGYEVINLIE